MKIVLWIVGIIVVLVLGFLLYMGAFSPVKVSQEKVQPFFMAYEDYVGEYKNVMPVFEKVNKHLISKGIKPTKGVGVYLDDPKTVAKDKLRSMIGYMITDADIKTLKPFAKEFKIQKVMFDKAIVAEFPLKNQLSILLGITKVYPTMSKYLVANKLKGGPVAEIYDMNINKIIYVMQLL